MKKLSAAVLLILLLCTSLAAGCHYSCGSCSDSEFYQCTGCGSDRIAKPLPGLGGYCKCSEMDDFDSCKSYGTLDNVIRYLIYALFPAALLIGLALYFVRQQITPFLITLDYVQFAGLLFLTNNRLGLSLEDINSYLANYNISFYFARGIDRFFDENIYDTQTSEGYADVLQSYPKMSTEIYGVSLLHNAIYLYAFFVLSLLIYLVIRLVIKIKKLQEEKSRLHFFKGVPAAIFYISLYETVVYVVMQAKDFSGTIDYILIAVTGVWLLFFTVLALVSAFKQRASVQPSDSKEVATDRWSFLFRNIKPSAGPRHRLYPFAEIVAKVAISVIVILLYKKVQVQLIVVGGICLVSGILIIVNRPNQQQHYNIIHTISKACQTLLVLCYIMIYQSSGSTGGSLKIWSQILLYFLLATGAFFFGANVLFVVKSENVKREEMGEGGQNSSPDTRKETPKKASSPSKSRKKNQVQPKQDELLANPQSKDNLRSQQNMPVIEDIEQHHSNKPQVGRNNLNSDQLNDINLLIENIDRQDQNEGGKGALLANVKGQPKPVSGPGKDEASKVLSDKQVDKSKQSKEEMNQKMKELWNTNKFEEDLELVQQHLEVVDQNLQKIPSKVEIGSKAGAQQRQVKGNKSKQQLAANPENLSDVV